MTAWPGSPTARLSDRYADDVPAEVYESEPVSFSVTVPSDDDMVPAMVITDRDTVCILLAALAHKWRWHSTQPSYGPQSVTWDVLYNLAMASADAGLDPAAITGISSLTF